ncbi:hypothetical protein PMAYCL1PPCAC_17449 [Pristionchus mayeri]|uniref:Uncharacterized protein n=1 Tax=Pristionchus mayeri TaxID=1317129 RepID=A0AAN5CMQ7_9BILA|nr:hypothetical protein PMAYCL1PPCAC_17449 [Pristionchus mayeri]
MLPSLPSLLPLLSLFALSLAQYQQWPPVVNNQRQQPSSHNLNGNAALYGAGTGDVYVGRLGDGLYGAGTRFGGMVGIGGTGGYAGGQGTRGKRALVTNGLRGTAIGQTERTEDFFRASGVVSGEANFRIGDNVEEEERVVTSTQPSTTTRKPHDELWMKKGDASGSANKEESAVTSTQSSSTSSMSKQRVESKKPLRAVCAPRRLRAGRR